MGAKQIERIAADIVERAPLPATDGPGRLALHRMIERALLWSRSNAFEEAARIAESHTVPDFAETNAFEEGGITTAARITDAIRMVAAKSGVPSGSREPANGNGDGT